jgi:hypothetical protein
VAVFPDKIRLKYGRRLIAIEIKTGRWVDSSLFNQIERYLLELDVLIVVRVPTEDVVAIDSAPLEDILEKNLNILIRKSHQIMSGKRLKIPGIMQNRCPVCRRYNKENRCNFCSTHDLTKIKKICKTCGKTFPIRKSEIIKRPNRGQYCSQKCRKLGKYIKCLQCGKLFPAPPCEIRRGRKYCNSKCYGKAKQTKVKTNCQICGKETDTTRYYMLRDWKKFCSPECQYKGQMKGEYRTCKTCKISFYVTRWEAQNGKGVFCSPECYDRGLTMLNDKIRASTKYRKWHATVLRRDNYRCQNPKCPPDKSYNRLQVHHIKRLSDIIYEHGITTVVEAIECEAIWDYDNATTLCIPCHAKVDKSILNMSHPILQKRSVKTGRMYQRKIRIHNYNCVIKCQSG